MYRIAIVEDDSEAITVLQSFVERFFAESGIEVEVKSFANPLRFLESAAEGFALVFMDIDMPVMDGMEAARRLRAVDDQTVFVFVTNLSTLAANGYEVDAADFIVKPLDYDIFAVKMQRIMRLVRRSEATMTMVRTPEGIRMVRLDAIRFVEVQGHRIFFHTDDGVICTRGTLKDVAVELGSESFALCNKCYLVNLARVEAIDKLYATVGGEQVQVSRPRRQDFLRALAAYHASH